MWRSRNISLNNQTPSTLGILQQADPHSWQDHHFGLPQARWNNLNGRSYWITGAGTGYGRSIALALAAAGSQVFMTGRRKNKLNETLEEGVSLGINVDNLVFAEADISVESEVNHAVSIISHHVAQLDGLVNCAALPQTNISPFPLADQSVSAWSEIITTNLTAQWLTSRAALPLMVNNNSIRIIFMSSEAGWATTSGFGPYNVSKSAVNTLSASLAAECRSHYPNHDVQINTIVPGEARTEMNQNSNVSPYSIVSMTLALLSHPRKGPNGCFFHRDGRHLDFAYSAAYLQDLLSIRQ